jgi:hypothetical protein
MVKSGEIVKTVGKTHSNLKIFGILGQQVINPKATMVTTILPLWNDLPK